MSERSFPTEQTETRKLEKETGVLAFNRYMQERMQNQMLLKQSEVAKRSNTEDYAKRMNEAVNEWREKLGLKETFFENRIHFEPFIAICDQWLENEDRGTEHPDYAEQKKFLGAYLYELVNRYVDDEVKFAKFLEIETAKTSEQSNEETRRDIKMFLEHQDPERTKILEAWMDDWSEGSLLYDVREKLGITAENQKSFRLAVLDVSVEKPFDAKKSTFGKSPWVEAFGEENDCKGMFVMKDPDTGEPILFLSSDKVDSIRKTQQYIKNQFTYAVAGFDRLASKASQSEREVPSLDFETCDRHIDEQTTQKIKDLFSTMVEAGLIQSEEIPDIRVIDLPSDSKMDPVTNKFLPSQLEEALGIKYHFDGRVVQNSDGRRTIVISKKDAEKIMVLIQKYELQKTKPFAFDQDSLLYEKGLIGHEYVHTQREMSFGHEHAFGMLFEEHAATKYGGGGGYSDVARVLSVLDNMLSLGGHDSKGSFEQGVVMDEPEKIYAQIHEALGPKALLMITAVKPNAYKETEGASGKVPGIRPEVGLRLGDLIGYIIKRCEDLYPGILEKFEKDIVNVQFETSKRIEYLLSGNRMFKVEFPEPLQRIFERRLAELREREGKEAEEATKPKEMESPPESTPCLQG